MLIQTLKPKIVIFEGKSAYETMIKDCLSQKNTWSKEFKFGYYKENSIHYLGYSRYGSTILSNRIEFTNKLKEIME